MVIVKTGAWLYDGEVTKPVDIVGLDYDFWYEIARADEQLEPGQSAEPLGRDGLLYYVRFVNAGESAEPTWTDSIGFDSIDAALRDAEAQAPSTITWL